jgi:hypothetical protein
MPAYGWTALHNVAKNGWLLMEHPVLNREKGKYKRINCRLFWIEWEIDFRKNIGNVSNLFRTATINKPNSTVNPNSQSARDAQFAVALPKCL